jgi:hypothetical protein
MAILTFPLAALAWLGRQGTVAVACIVFLAMVTSPVGTALRPYITESVFALLCIAFIRVDIAVLWHHLSRPATAIAATAWTTLGIPLLLGGICLLLGVKDALPGLFLGLMLQFAASPMMAAPALAMLMGLDATLVLIVLVASTAMVPLTAPFFAWVFIGDALSVAPQTLGIKLGSMLLGAVVVSWLIRRLAGMERIRLLRAEIDGINIIVLYIFAATIMGDYLPSLMHIPWTVTWVSLLALCLFAGYYLLTVLLFRWAGPEQARALGVMASMRNLGLMLAATGGALPELTWIYFASSQFPIHLAPALLKWWALRKLRKT